MTIEYDKQLKHYTVFFEGDDLVFDTKAEAQAFINGQ